MTSPSQSFAADTKNWALKVVKDDESPTVLFRASLPFRKVLIEGPSPEEATAGLVRYYASLARMGDFNPHFPDAPGVPPIQHVLSILEEMLRENIQRRESNRTFSYECDMKADDRNSTTNTRPGGRADGAPTWGSAYAKSPAFLRDNEVISGLATAIAALARVKEL